MSFFRQTESWPWPLGTPVNVTEQQAPVAALPNEATTSMRAVRPPEPWVWPAPTLTRPCAGGQCGKRTACFVPLLTQTSVSADDEHYRAVACAQTLNDRGESIPVKGE